MKAARCSGVDGKQCRNAPEKKNKVILANGGYRFLCKQCMKIHAGR